MNVREKLRAMDLNALYAELDRARKAGDEAYAGQIKREITVVNLGGRSVRRRVKNIATQRRPGPPGVVSSSSKYALDQAKDEGDVEFVGSERTRQRRALRWKAELTRLLCGRIEWGDYAGQQWRAIPEPVLRRLAGTDGLKTKPGTISKVPQNIRDHARRIFDLKAKMLRGITNYMRSVPVSQLVTCRKHNTKR